MVITLEDKLDRLSSNFVWLLHLRTNSSNAQNAIMTVRYLKKIMDACLDLEKTLMLVFSQMLFKLDLRSFLSDTV